MTQNIIKNRKSNALDVMRILVIGAGPAGLTFAKSACENGADVVVLERAGDPRGDDTGYTNRSFNLTLNIVGRKALGDKRAWNGGIELNGRAIHDPINGQVVKYANFGNNDADVLTSVPRPLLRQNLVTLAEEKSAIIRFRTEVISIDPNEASVMIRRNNAIPETIRADLIIVADGLHSLANKMVENMASGSLRQREEPLNYVTVLLDAKVCKGLSLHHIHFWHQPNSKSVAIGLPNKDGSIAALLISRYDDNNDNLSPFLTSDKALSRLRKDFPNLLALNSCLVEHVLGKKRDHFYYKSVTNYVLGKRCVVVGDAGSAAPPWAGFGANTAIYSADSLVRFLCGLGGNIDQALHNFERHKLILADLVLKYADEHGEFLNKGVAQNPNDRPIGPVLGGLINKAIENSNIPMAVQLLTF